MLPSYYTTESYEAFQTALANAESVADNADAAQEEIDTAAASLLAALEGLQWKDITASLDPAAPNGKNGWYTSPVTVTLSPAKIAEYSLDGGDTWTAYSEPVVLDQEGTHQVQYRRSVDTGETNSLEVKIDLSAPMVQIMGEASYTIDQTVTITCSANDVVSSVYGTPCDQPLLQVKAYTLESGEHTATVTVEDMAGNQTTADHTFTVMVTFDSLKTVTNAIPAGDGRQRMGNRGQIAESKAGPGESCGRPRKNRRCEEHDGRLYQTGNGPNREIFHARASGYSDPLGSDRDLAQTEFRGWHLAKA